jgi:hypothetical protein
MVEEREKKEAEKLVKWREQKRLRTAAVLQSGHLKTAMAATAGAKNAL